MKTQRSTQRKESRFKWTPDLENIVIKLWKDNLINLRREKHNGHVYKRMSTDIQEAMGTVVTVNEITAKIKNLKRKYIDERNKIERTGSPSSWRLYEKVHVILGGSAAPNLMMQGSIKTESEYVDNVYTCPTTPSLIGSDNFWAENIKTEPGHVDSMVSQSTSWSMGSENKRAASSPVSSSASVNTFVDAPDLRPRKRGKKRNYHALLLEEFKRANLAAEALAKEANSIQSTANSLLERSLKIQEEILKRLK